MLSDTQTRRRLELGNIGHTFGLTEIISSVSLSVGENEVVALVGPSGCGKTTLLNVAAGLLEPTEGTVQSEFHRSACLFQEPRLLPLTAAYGFVAVALWGADTTGWLILPLPDDRGGWHIHEMVFGFVGAGLAGFLLTAVPSWTSTPPVTGRPLQALVALWLLARTAAWCAGLVGAAPMTLLSLLFTGAVAAAVGRPLWREAQGRHRVFLLLVLCLAAVQAAVHVYWALEDIVQVRALLDVAIGLFLMLILAAMGRISMVIVNQAPDDDEDEPFVARPPLRRFAIGVLAIFLLVDYLLPYSTTSGWVALAAAAAVLNLLNDWHHRGVWRDPYVQVLYLVHLFMALGFGLLGVSYLWEIYPANFARHAFAVGSIGLSVLAVLTIAGQRHTGRGLSGHWRIRTPLLCLAGAAVARIVPPWLDVETVVPVGYGLSSLLWCLAFALYLSLFWGFLTKPRPDGLPG